MSEQKTFKYLDQAQGSDVAQDFLNKKMSKNKYASVSNPDNPYSMGEGSTPSAPVYDKKPEAKAEAPSGGSELSKSYGSLSDLGFDEARIEEIRNHAQGASGSDSFGYSSNTEQHFKETEDGTSSGSIEADMRKIGKHMGYEHWGTANPERIKKYIMEQEAPQAQAAPEAKAEVTPIKHSPEIKQAKERVQSYEQDVLSGETSKQIFGKGEEMAKNNYTFDASQGAEALGSSPSAKADANTATASFLDNKVAQTKKQLQLN